MPEIQSTPASGRPAAPAHGASEALPGDAGAESLSAETTPAKELPSASAIVDAWLAGDDGSPDEKLTTPPGEEGTDPAAAEAAAAAEAGEGEDANTDDKGEPREDTRTTEESDPAAQLDHLIDAVLKMPDAERKESKAYKRMSKLLGEPVTLKRQLAEATGKLKDAQGPPVVVKAATDGDPWASVATEADLTKGMAQMRSTKSNAEQWIEWCTDNKDGGAPPGADEEKGYMDSAAVKAKLSQARNHLRWANSMLDAAPAKQAWLKGLGETRAALRQSNPELFEKDSPELAEVVSLLETGRISTEQPDYMRDALDLLRGRKIREDEQRGVRSVKLDTKAAAAKAAVGRNGSEHSPQTRPGPQGATPGTRTPAARPASAVADLAAAKQKALAGDTKSLAVLIDAFAGAA